MMGLKRIDGSSKGQFMSIATLIFGLIIISSLLIFVIVGINYDQISQNSALSSSSTNYGVVLQKSADSFAYSSGSAALNALYMYESNPSLRGSNFITNFSSFMQYLIVNGTIPNAAPGSAAAKAVSGFMSNATFVSYNSAISSITGTGSKQITVSETRPDVYQNSPYYISISYTESVSINTSVGSFSLVIPVNASIPLNNTPDLFYAQQGIYSPVRFGSLGSLASTIGNDYASYGSEGSFVYGIVQDIPSPSGCSITLPSTALGSAAYKSQVIIVTQNAMGITSPSCTALNGYGGLITQNLSSQPSVPYLQFSAANNALQYLSTGEKVLLYGPGLAVLNISGLIGSVNSGSYFASQFASSYSQRASGNLWSQSPDGIFTLGGYGAQAASFNSVGITTSENQNSITSYTIAAWIYPTSQNGLIVSSTGQPAHGISLGMGGVLKCGALSSSLFFGDVSGSEAIGVNTVGQLQTNRWYFVAGTFNSMSGAVSASQFRLYVNGVNATSGSCVTGSDTSPLSASSGTTIGGLGYNGLIAGVQIYDSALSAAQVYGLYQEGIQNLPFANQMLVGWYPLDGNANDYSGSGFAPTLPSGNGAISYTLLPGYMRDSALVTNVSQYSYPLPGIGNCNNNAQCANIETQHLYLNDMPLSISNGGLSAAYFDGRSSYFEQGGGFNFTQNSITPSFSLSVWVYPTSANGVIVQQLGHQSIQSSPQESLLELKNGGLMIRTSSASCASVGSLQTGSWSNIAVAFSGTTGYAVYINGKQTGSGTAARTLPTGGVSAFYPLGAGVSSANACGYGVPFTGMMANYQFYNTTLNQNAVNSIYGQGIDGAPVIAANVVGWWPLNGNLNDYSGNQNTGIGNSLSFRFIAANYSSLNSQTYNSIGLGSISGFSGEWQALGLQAATMQPVEWNVTAWTAVGTGSNPLPYATLIGNPKYAGITSNEIQTGEWYSGFVGGDQGWNFGTDAYRGTNYFGSPTVAFPQMLNILNRNIACSSPYTTVGYTAITNMTLSGRYNFSIAFDDEMAVFYREGATGSWTDVFGGNGWSRTPGPNQGAQVLTQSVTFAPGTYQFVVDWLNGCDSGMSQLLMT